MIFGSWRGYRFCEVRFYCARMVERSRCLRAWRASTRAVRAYSLGVGEPSRTSILRVRACLSRQRDCGEVPRLWASSFQLWAWL